MTETQDSSSRYRPWQIKIFAATWLAYVGYYFCRKAFYIVKPDIKDALDLSASDLGDLGIAYLVAYMVGQFSSAFFGRKLGPKLLLLVGMGISIGCNIVFGASNSFWTVMLFLALNGLAQGTGWPGCIGSLAFWFKRRQRGSVLGVWSTCYQFGSVAAGAYAAFLLGLWGWRSSFFGACVVLLVIWFLVLLLHPDRPERVGLEPLEDEEEEPEESTATAEADTGEDQPAGREPLGWTSQVVVTILMMGAVYFCIKFLRYAMWSWTTTFLRANFSIKGDEAGYLSTVFDICGFAGVILAGFVTDRLFKGRRAFVAVAMLVLMTASFGLLYGLGSQSLTFFTLALGLAGFGLYGPDSLISGVGAIDVGSKRGALVAAGLINGMGSAGPVVQELVISRRLDVEEGNLLPIFLMLLAVAAAGTVLTGLLWLRSRAGKATL